MAENSSKVFLNGSIIPADEAKISVFDSGLLHGASAFTTMLAHNGVVFRLDHHLRRLIGTASLLRLRLEVGAEELAAAVREVLQANSLDEARMRITLTPGSVNGSDTDKPTVIITAEPLKNRSSRWYEDGINVIVSSFRQARGDPAFGNKTGCYLTRIMALKEAAAKGAEEALFYTTDNHLAEACFCSVFLVLEGKVCTPPLATPVLPGIVRQAVLDLCGSLGVEFKDEEPLTVKEMLAAEEMFLTASVSGIRPVVRVERHEVGGGNPGEITKSILAAYKDLLDHECRTG